MISLLNWGFLQSGQSYCSWQSIELPYAWRHFYSRLLIQWEEQEITYRVSWQIDQILCFCLAATQSTWQEPQQEEETTTVDHKTPKMPSTLFKTTLLWEKSVCAHVAYSHANLLEKKGRVYTRKVFNPTGLVWQTNMPTVSLFWNTKSGRHDITWKHFIG